MANVEYSYSATATLTGVYTYDASSGSISFTISDTNYDFLYALNLTAYIVIKFTRSFVGATLSMYVTPIKNGVSQDQVEVELSNSDAIYDSKVINKEDSITASFPIGDADSYVVTLNYTQQSLLLAIGDNNVAPLPYIYVPVYKVVTNNTGSVSTYNNQFEPPKFEISVTGYLDQADSDKQTFDIWIKDIEFNIAEINKNENSLTIRFDSYYNLYKDVVDGETDPPDGITEEEYLTQILSYLELLSSYFSDIGLTYGWEQIKAGVEGTDDVSAFIVRPETYETDAEYISYLDKKISKTSGDIATGNSGSGNLYKYFGTQNPVVKFTTGDIAGEYEYELAVIGGEPQVFEDTSRSHNGVQSKYRLTLMRNSDDYDATGLYLPGGSRQAKAGDRFELSKIELPFSWLYDGENRQEEYMRSQLADIDTHQPDVAIELDDIFLTKVLGDERHKDYGKFKAGATIKVKSPLIDVYNADGEKSDEYEVRINSYTKTSKETKVSQS